MQPDPPALIKDPVLVEDRRREIAQAAFGLFVHRGYHNTTVRQIAGACGLSSGSLFNYFHSKEEILRFVFDEEHKKIEEGLRRIAESPRTDPVAAFREAYESYLRFSTDNRDYLLLVYQEFKSVSKEHKHDIREREHRIVSLFRALIEAGIAAGCFRDRDLDLRIHNLIVLAHMWTFRRWALQEFVDVDGFIKAQTALAEEVLGMPGAGMTGAR